MRGWDRSRKSDGMGRGGAFMTALLIATCKVFESVDRRREIVQECFFFAVGGARD